MNILCGVHDEYRLRQNTPRCKRCPAGRRPHLERRVFAAIEKAKTHRGMNGSATEAMNSHRSGSVPRERASIPLNLLEKARADTIRPDELESRLGGLSERKPIRPEAGWDERDCPREASIGPDASLSTSESLVSCSWRWRAFYLTGPAGDVSSS